MKPRSTALAVVLALVAAAVAFSTSTSFTGEAKTLDVKEITLDNGLRIYVLEKSTSPTKMTTPRTSTAMATNHPHCAFDSHRKRQLSASSVIATVIMAGCPPLQNRTVDIRSSVCRRGGPT